jgi:hypothetical protein
VTIHWSKITEQKYRFLVASMWGNDPFGQMWHVPEKRKKILGGWTDDLLSNETSMKWLSWGASRYNR